MRNHTDVIVIGGGHAGVEAAAAAARMGVTVTLVTGDLSKIGEMSCNPAIGGLGKGHLVREVDALDGLMGRVIDRSGIQFRLLNRSKGPAVRGPRAQADRRLYKVAMQAELSATEGLTCRAALVTGFVMCAGRCEGVVLSTGEEVRSAAVVLTAGTFLRGVIHRGHDRIEAGRIGEAPARDLGVALERLGLPTGRLKTGTPPRLDGRTIDWSVLEKQPADAEPVPFSFLTDRIEVRQVECGITYTNARTHDVISRNLGSSAVYGGAISGQGPRYCPSIEDKVVRFAEKDAHQVFLEPEGLDDDTVYPNGISTSLPTEVQHDLVRSMKGLEKAEITQPGYAIEYDYVDPRALRRTLAVRDVPGLFLAGQVNGTTGYEEAAGQGILAGINAARLAKAEEPFVIGRHEGYLGVMVDDLVTKGVSEPYRMFTSRAEYRLSLRADNADERLTPLGINVGCVSSHRAKVFHVKQEAVQRSLAWARATSLTPAEASVRGIMVNQDGRRRSVIELLALPGQDATTLSAIWLEVSAMPRPIKDRLEADALYAGYLDRQAKEIEDLARNDALIVPADLNLDAVRGLSNEVRAKLSATRPETLGQAGRMEGMTPSALATLLIAIRQHEAEAARHGASA